MARWTPSSPTGIEDLDAQHRSFLERGEALDQAIAKEEPGPGVEDLLRFLVLHAEEHFATEERLMQESQYPDTAPHARDHAEFRRRLRFLLLAWDAQGDSPALRLALVGFLRFWQADHVNAHDGRLAEYLRARGLAPRAVAPASGRGAAGGGDST